MLCPTNLITEDIIIMVEEYRKEGKLGGIIACIVQVLILVKKIYALHNKVACQNTHESNHKIMCFSSNLLSELVTK